MEPGESGEEAQLVYFLDTDGRLDWDLEAGPERMDRLK